MEKEVEKLILEELREIKTILHDHTNKHEDHTKELDDHTMKLDEHSQILHLHSETIKEHGRMLSALRIGQEELKAVLDSMKIQNAKEFGEIKEQLKNTEASMEVLKDETFMKKKDIYRIKTTMGMK